MFASLARLCRILLPLVAGLAAGAALAADDTLPPLRYGPIPDFLLWTQPQREVGYRNYEKLYTTAPVARGTRVHPLRKAAREIVVEFDHAGQHMNVDSFMESGKLSGLLIMKDGEILLERYRAGMTADQRWTSFSVAKSVTSTLVGAAVHDGYIKSIDDPVTRYIPQMKGSAYDRVSVRQLMMMASGIRWNEDVFDFNSDYMKLFSGDFIAPMMDRPQIHPAGSTFHYNTADTNLVGTLVMQATGKPLSTYLSEKIWAPYGMEKDAAWLLVNGKETGGACISMTLRDYGRFGEFIREGAMIDGKPVVPDGWIADATSSHIATGWGDVGYGYLWWVNKDKTFRALGVFGQFIFVDIPNKIVIVGLGAWDKPEDEVRYQAEDAFIAAVEKTLAK